MRELRCALESVDSGCPNQHYTKYVDTLQHTVQLKGHPLVCSNDGGCHSQLQIIRSAATIILCWLHFLIMCTLQEVLMWGKLLIELAQLITQFESEVDDYPEHVCCSCECLYQRKSVTKVKLSDKLGNAVWPRLKEFILGQCPNTNEVGTMYMCNYCKSSIKNNKLPPRCVLNGLEPVPIPVELAKLDALSAQLIQLAKCYQIISKTKNVI